MAIPYARQHIEQADIDAVVAVLKSDFLTQGPAVESFEKAAAEFCGAKYAVAVSNATAALHLACMALDLKKGELLWTSPNTFVASANCARYCGADVDFVDIDPDTLNMSVSELERKLADAEKRGKLPKVVVPVHFGGQSCEMDKIRALARRYGFKVVEDASHAVGATYRGKRVGACEFSDMAVFSFHAVKIMTSGEGGMVLTNDLRLAERLKLLRTHGITRDTARMRGDSHGAWYFQQLELGYNYRLTDIQSALGLAQLGRIETFLSRRQKLAERYASKLEGVAVRSQKNLSGAVSSWHLYAVRLQLDKIKKTQRQVHDELIAKGVLVNLHYIPVHLHPYYADLGFKEGQFPQAERYYREALSLPMYYGLSDQDQDRVVETLRSVLG